MLGIYYMGQTYTGSSGGSFSETFDVIANEESGPIGVSGSLKPSGSIVTSLPLLELDSTMPTGLARDKQISFIVGSELPEGFAGDVVPRGFSGAPTPSIRERFARYGDDTPYSLLCDDPVALCDDPDELAGQYVDYAVVPSGGVIQGIIMPSAGSVKPSGVVR